MDWAEMWVRRGVYAIVRSMAQKRCRIQKRLLSRLCGRIDFLKRKWEWLSEQGLGECRVQRIICNGRSDAL
jgi:hypothetical protein